MKVMVRRLVGDCSEITRVLGVREWREHLARRHNVSFLLSHLVTIRNLTGISIIDDNIMSEARNLLNMTQAQTPLLGEENTPIHVAPDGGTGFESATPRHQVAFTPNPLATPLRSGSSIDGLATPRSDAGTAFGATPLRTPMRDNLNLNLEDGTSSVGDTPREQRLRATAAKRALQMGFSSLPKPRNDFEIMVPEDEEIEEDEGRFLSEEDAAERDARIRRRNEEQERKMLARRSTAVQKNLPRPANIDVGHLLKELQKLTPDDDPELGKARRLVDVELVHMLEHDSIVYPLPGTSKPGGTQSTYEIPEDDYLAEAKSLVHRELVTSLGFPDANEEQIKRGLTILAREEEVDLESDGWAQIREGLAYDANTRAWVDPATLSREERIAGFAALLEEDKDTMAKEAGKASKSEKKLGVVLGGYQARSKALTKRLTEAFEALQSTDIDLDSFSRLSVNEAAAGPRRVESLKEEVERLERRERELQRRYQELDEDRRDSRARIAAKEERMMAEAEALNEAALAEMEAAEAAA
jgi:pre-mRNA-splicing factor CDC5/CEF1